MCLEKHHRESAEHPHSQRQESSPPQSTPTAGRWWNSRGAGSSWQDYCGGQQPGLPTKPNWMEEGQKHWPSLVSSSLNPWGEGTKSIFHQEIQRPSGTVRSPGSKACSSCLSPLTSTVGCTWGRSLSLMAKQRTLTRVRCLPARRWISGPAPPPRSASGIWPRSTHCGALGWPALIPSPSQSHQGYALPKEVKDSEVAGFQWASKARAQCKENTCGLCLHIRMWGCGRTTRRATWRLALPPRSVLSRCANSQGPTSGSRARKRMTASLISWTGGESNTLTSLWLHGQGWPCGWLGFPLEQVWPLVDPVHRCPLHQ